MFLLQLQLYVLTIICVTLRSQDTETFRRKSIFCKFKYTVLSKGCKESQFSYSVFDQMYLQKSTWLLFSSVYFDATVS